MTVDSNETYAWSVADLEEGLGAEWLAVEAALYASITFAALLVRLAALGRWPLMEGEAHTALTAWRALQGTPPVRSFEYMPLLYDAHLALFALTKASDATVRLLPALVGTLFVLLPCFCRDVLGREGSLAASLLLAFAPTWVFFSRTAEGVMLTATLSAVILLSIERYLQEGDEAGLWWGFAALGLGLTAGPGIYTFLVYGLLYGGIWWLMWGDGDSRKRGRMLLQEAFTRRNVSILVAAFLLFGSAFLTNPGGIGVSINLGGQWVRALSSKGDLLPLALVKTLLTYEFLTVALALVGIVWGLRRKDGLTSFLALWVAWGILLSVLLGHREPWWLPGLLLPLVALAGRGFQYLWDWVFSGMGLMEGAALWGAITLAAFGFLELFAFTHTAQEKYLLYAVAGWTILLAGWGASWFWLGRRGTLRVGAGLLILCMTVMTVRSSTAVAYQTGRDARERMVHRPPSVQLRSLERSLLELSSRHTEGVRALDLDYEEGLEPWMGWYLRDYPNARPVPLADARAGGAALITAERPEEEWPAGYAGQGFYLQEYRPSQNLSGRQLLRWFFYRDAVGSTEAERIQVWIRVDEDDDR